MPPQLIDTLIQAIGSDKVKTDQAFLMERRHDYSVLSQLADLQGRGAPTPACVVTPKDTEDVVAILEGTYTDHMNFRYSFSGTDFQRK